MSPWRAMAAPDVVDMAARLRALDWSWQMDDAEQVYAPFGWQPISKKPRRIILDTGFGLGSGNIQAMRGRVVRIEVQITDIAGTDTANLAGVREAFDTFRDAMTATFGDPVVKPGKPDRPRWVGPVTTLILRVLGTALWLVLVTNERLAAEDQTIEMEEQGLL